MKTLVLAVMAALTLGGSMANADVVFTFNSDKVIESYSEFPVLFTGKHVIHEQSTAYVNDDGSLDVKTATVDYFYKTTFDFFAGFGKEFTWPLESTDQGPIRTTHYDNITVDLDQEFLGGNYLDSRN